METEMKCIVWKWMTDDVSMRIGVQPGCRAVECWQSHRCLLNVSRCSRGHNGVHVPVGLNQSYRIIRLERGMPARLDGYIGPFWAHIWPVHVQCGVSIDRDALWHVWCFGFLWAHSRMNVRVWCLESLCAPNMTLCVASRGSCKCIHAHTHTLTLTHTHLYLEMYMYL